MKKREPKVVTLGLAKPYNLVEACRGARRMVQRWVADPKVPPGIVDVLEAWYNLVRVDEQTARRTNYKYSESTDCRDVVFDLEAMIAEHCDPRTVEDVRRLIGTDYSPLMGSLYSSFLIHMIERDAEGHYDQIDGYIDYTIGSDEMVQLLTDPGVGKLNGLGITEWMDKHVPFSEDSGEDEKLSTTVLRVQSTITEVEDLLTQCTDRMDDLTGYMKRVKCSLATMEKSPRSHEEQTCQKVSPETMPETL